MSWLSDNLPTWAQWIVGAIVGIAGAGFMVGATVAATQGQVDSNTRRIKLIEHRQEKAEQTVHELDRITTRLEAVVDRMDRRDP